MNDELTEYDLRQMALFIRKSQAEQAMGKAISRDDFAGWAKQAAIWLLDRLESAWNYLRYLLGTL